MDTSHELKVGLDGDPNSLYLKSTVDCSAAVEAAKLATDAGGRIGKGSDEVCMVARIPTALYALDPLLQKAQMFLSMGDRAQAVHYMRMFLQLYPKFKVEVSRKYVQGCSL